MDSKQRQWLLVVFATLCYWGYGAITAVASTLPAQTNYSVCFSPNGQCERKIVFLIDNAQRSLRIQSYSFTSRLIARAVIDAKKRGVDVRMIVDRSLFDPQNTHSRIRTVMNEGIPVWVDNRVSIAHNKVLVVDGKTVETGSYNYTVSANRYNAENVLIIESGPLATQYLANWNSRLQHAIPAGKYHYKRKRRR